MVFGKIGKGLGKLAGVSGLAGYAYSKHRKTGKKNKSEQRKFKKEVAKYQKEQKKFMKKYGGEKFMQEKALTGPQRSLLNEYVEKAKQFRQVPEIAQDPLYQAGRQRLADILQNPERGYSEFREPALREFSQEIAPAIAARYGGVRSSGFQNRLASAGRDLGSKLGALRASLAQEATQFALPMAANYAGMPTEQAMSQNQATMGLGGMALKTNPYVNIYRPPTFANLPPPQQPVARQSFLSNLLSGMAPAAGGAIGMAMGGPIGGAIGSGLGSMFGGASSPAVPSAQSWGMNQMNRSFI